MPSANRGPEATFRRRRRPRFLALAQLLPLLALGPIHAQPQDRSLATPGVRVFPSGGLDAEAAALIMSGQEGGGLPLEVLAVPFIDSDTSRLMLIVEIAGQPLLADSIQSPLRVEFFAYLLTPDDSVRSWLLRSLEIDLESARPRLERGGLRLAGNLDVRPGEYSLRVLVRCVHSGQLGATVQQLEIPAPSTGRVLATASLESDSGSSWFDIELTEDTPGSSWATSPSPSPSLPPALPVVEAGQLARVRVAVTGAVVAPNAASVDILERPGGEPLSQVPLTLEVDAADPTGRHVVLAGDLRIPELASGRYRMRVVLRGVAAESVRTGELGFLVLDSPPSSLARGWPGLVSGPSLPPVPDEEAEDRTRAVWSESERTALTSLHRSYERALEHLATGDRPTAIGILSELETGLLQDHGYRALAMLRQTEVAMARRIADERPEGVLPVCLLHASLHGLYQQRGQAVLHDHSRLIALRMLELYVAATGPDGRVLASGALTDLAADLLRGQLFREAEEVLEQALAYDGENEAALLGLAAMYEKQGRYAKAVTALLRLLKTRPGHSEALLRLAINHLRLGHPARGRRVLADLVAEGSPPWVTSIAYQELARERLREGEVEGAERLLRQSLESLPGHDELYVQLAMVLDLSGRSAAAAAVLDDLDRVRRPDRESARRRYNQLPLSLFETVGPELEAVMEQRLADLEVALTSTRSTPAG